MDHEIKYYESMSQGKIPIKSMTYNHLVNAIKKMENTVYYSNDGNMRIIERAITKPVYQDLLEELGRRNPSDKFNAKYNFIIENSN